MSWGSRKISVLLLLSCLCRTVIHNSLNNQGPLLRILCAVQPTSLPARIHAVPSSFSTKLLQGASDSVACSAHSYPCPHCLFTAAPPLQPAISMKSVLSPAQPESLSSVLLQTRAFINMRLGSMSLPECAQLLK